MPIEITPAQQERIATEIIEQPALRHYPTDSWLFLGPLLVALHLNHGVTLVHGAKKGGPHWWLGELKPEQGATTEDAILAAALAVLAEIDRAAEAQSR